MTIVAFQDTPATGSVAIYNWKTFLKGLSVPWEVLSSSDGTTYSSSSDIITSGGSGANGMANNFAWFVIRRPGGAGQVSYSIQKSNSGNQTWRVKMSLSSGFSGGSPSAVRTPSATDEQIILGGGTDAAPSFANLFATDASYRQKIVADNANTYPFWQFCFPNGGGAVNHAFLMDALSVIGADACAYAWVIGAQNLLYTALGASSGNGPRSFFPSAAPTIFQYYPMLSFNDSTGIFAPQSAGVNPITLKDDLFPIAFGRRAALMNPGYKGQSLNLYYESLNRATGDTNDYLSTRDRIIADALSIPWDGSVVVI